MKKFLFLFLPILFLFLMPQAGGAPIPDRGLFVSVIQDPEVLASRQAITDLVTFAKKARIGTLFVQVYRANQSWFPSKTADQTPYLSCLKAVGEDPFALLIKKAHAAGIEVHAWVNLLSLAKNTQAPLLKKYGPSILTRNKNKKKALDDYKMEDQYFLEPGDPRVRTDLLSMTGDLVRAYPTMDGIQFDYIRYPDKEPGYTKINMDRFKESSGQVTIEDASQVWGNWKRAQVTELLERLVKRVRVLRPGLKLSITGCAPYLRAFGEAFQDWPSWVNSGLVDFVTVMTYSADVVEFKKNVLDAQAKVVDLKKLNIAVGAYQQVKWPEIFSSQWEFCAQKSKGSCVVFHYGSLIEGPALKGSLIK